MMANHSEKNQQSYDYPPRNNAHHYQIDLSNVRI